MRVFQFNIIKFLLTGNKPFCLFRILNTFLYAEEYRTVLPGNIVLRVNSSSEHKELTQLFKDHGFEVEGGGKKIYKTTPKKKKLIDPNSLKLTFDDFREEPNDDLRITIWNLEDDEKFLEFLKVLSREYGYKTFYQQQRHSIIK